MKKILIVNHYATPPMYGGLNRHHFFAKYLKKNGYDVKILASSAIHNSSVNMIEKNEKNLFKEMQIDGVDYIYVKTCSYKSKLKRVINMLQFYIRGRRVVKKIDKYDVVYSSSPQPLSVLLGFKIAKKMHAKSLIEIRDLWPATIVDLKILGKNNPIITILYKLEKYMYLKADKIIFTMEGGIEYIKEQKYANKIDLKKIYHLNNGIDLEKFTKDKKEYKVNDSDLENNKTFKVVYAGSIRQAYNITQIIDLAKMVQEKKYNNIIFLIYGKGPYVDSLRKRCEEEKIKNVKFKGFIDSKYIPYILSKANLILMQAAYYDCLKYGTSQNKLFTYLASEKPIISTITNKYDLIKNYKCGVSLEKFDIEDYCEALIKFYNMNEKEYKSYCENCKKLVKKYDYEKLTLKLIDIIEK